MITHILRKRGHSVAVANNGREAVQLAAQQDFDLILMDVQMPVVDGFRSPRAWAFTLLGLDAYCAVVPGDAEATTMARVRTSV